MQQPPKTAGALLRTLVNVKHAYVIVTAMELERASTVATIKALRQALEPDVNIHVFPATDARVTVPAVSLTRRAQWSLRTGLRDSGLDVCTKGAVGCADSHLRLLQHIAAQGDGGGDAWTLVLESDAQVRMRQLRQLVAASGGHVGPQDSVSMIVLGRPPMSWPPACTTRVPGRPGLCLATDTWYGTHALLVRNRHAAAIAAAVQPLEVQIDGALGIAACLGHIPPVWLARANAIGQNRNFLNSSIQTDRSLKAVLPASNKQLVPLIVVPYVLMVLLAVALVVACVLLTRKPTTTSRRSLAPAPAPARSSTRTARAG